MIEQKPKLCVLTEWPVREGWETDFLTRTLLREGIYAEQIQWLSLLSERPYGGNIYSVGEQARESALEGCREALRPGNAKAVLVCGDYLTGALSGKRGIDKWQCSVLPSEYGHLIPCYSTDRVSKDLSLQLWVSLCARKAAECLRSERKEPKHDFLLNPPLDEALEFLRRVRTADRVSVDIETGRGQINTVGFAISASEAIAINVLPDRLGPEAHFRLWSALDEILSSDQPKVLQNFIYEHLFFSRYGIRMRGVAHDTMICQKFLWPEFEMGLDAVGRMYSQMSYWKDDGKSWNNIRDWNAHYDYNCKDTTGTYEGYIGQRVDLAERGLADLHDSYIRRLFPAIAEMCSRGLPVAPERLFALQSEVRMDFESTLATLKGLPGAEALNPRSPAQVKVFLQAPPRKYSIPKKYDSKEKKHKESTDEKSIKKLRLKHPEDPALPLLLRVAKLGKAQSAYLSFGYDKDERMRFMLNGHGTETGRFSGSMDPWGGGVNPQTVPGGNKGVNIKSCFAAPAGRILLQIDLKQAESRFVAYDSADPNLIAALEDSSRDIHREVAAEIYGIPVSTVSKQQRQLGKKSGHGANYSMKEATFQDSCISEMDLVLSHAEATKVLEAYHKLFPGIRQWHASIRRELAQTRSLRTPLGRVRQFWGRLDDDTFRQAYAYKPQSTIPDVTNHLMLWLLDLRDAGALDFGLLLQCHDSLLLEVPEGAVEPVVCAAFRYDEWHPRIDLPGGRLRIPVDIELGRNWGNLINWGKRNGHESTENKTST